ncbi:MAG TPA: 1-acyl-sn-glycerol-3-phosphate acyltransferase, partial [Alphaproteobacteria bacterium]|nr:1-acyl-sn-glycerol-3-phosphate acyltransferase [Alphaproteobacteria bacterium]
MNNADARMSRRRDIRKWSRIVFSVAMTAFLLPPYILGVILSPPIQRLIAKIWFAGCCRLCALRLKVSGIPEKAHPVLYIANHVSYLDILILGRLLDATFVAKAEIAKWPLVGFLAKLARTMFINRTSLRAMEQRNRMAQRLARENMILFPEGTSTDGQGLAPFKTALFSAAMPGPRQVSGNISGNISGNVIVQPVSIAYTRYADGGRLVGDLVDYYAWYGDMVMAPHLMKIFSLDGAEVEVCFHDAVNAAAFADRKGLAAYCEETIA